MVYATILVRKILLLSLLLRLLSMYYLLCVLNTCMTVLIFQLQQNRFEFFLPFYTTVVATVNGH